MRLTFTASAVVVLSACATQESAPTQFVDVPQYEAPACAAPVVVNEVRQIKPTKRRKVPDGRTVKPKTVNAYTIFPWTDGKIYPVSVQVGRITTILLKPGEFIPGQVAYGDTLKSHWVVETTKFGPRAAPISAVLIRAGEPGLKTTAVIATNMRIYQLDLESYADRAMDFVKWTYPEEEDAPEPQQPLAAASVDAFDPLALNTAYRVEVLSGSPRWKPTAVYDYGYGPTFIRFPGDIATQAAPVLYEVNGGGLGNPIPFVVQGSVYRAHRGFAAAELRLGEEAVRITRTGQ